MNAAPPFPWQEAMAFGFGVLRLSSDAFWKLTPLELAAATRLLTGDAPPLSRGALNKLLQRFPDRKKL